MTASVTHLPVIPPSRNAREAEITWFTQVAVSFGLPETASRRVARAIVEGRPWDRPVAAPVLAGTP